MDRAEAIRAAVEACDEGDALLIAGKGHETYQIIGDARLPLDEREIVRQLLSGRGRP